MNPNWQQAAFREDPYPEIPFDDPRPWWTSDALVGVACLVLGLLGVFL